MEARPPIRLSPAVSMKSDFPSRPVQFPVEWHTSPAEPAQFRRRTQRFRSAEEAKGSCQCRDSRVWWSRHRWRTPSPGWKAPPWILSERLAGARKGEPNQSSSRGPVEGLSQDLLWEGKPWLMEENAWRCWWQCRGRRKRRQRYEEMRKRRPLPGPLEMKAAGDPGIVLSRSTRGSSRQTSEARPELILNQSARIMSVRKGSQPKCKIASAFQSCQWTKSRFRRATTLG